MTEFRDKLSSSISAWEDVITFHLGVTGERTVIEGRQNLMEDVPK